MWYFSPTEGMLRHSTYVASINHKNTGYGYTLTDKVPTWQHNCLSHVLSNANFGTASGTLEVWGGPLSNGDAVIALLNRGSSAATIAASWTMLQMTSFTSMATLQVTDLWTGKSLGAITGGFSMQVDAHDLHVYRVTKKSIL